MGSKIWVLKEDIAPIVSLFEVGEAVGNRELKWSRLARLILKCSKITQYSEKREG